MNCKLERLVRPAQVKRMANIIESEMEWMNGWGTSAEIQRKCAEKAVKRILRMTIKPNADDSKKGRG
jgi:hypothetical protein